MAKALSLALWVCSLGSPLVSCSAYVEQSAEVSFEEQGLVPPDSVNLNDYFPTQRVTQTYRRADGALYGNFTYFPATADFRRLYDTFFTLNKSGRLGIWAKTYANGCTATYAHLFFGTDGSATEVGDYFAVDRCRPSIAFGYADPSGQHNDGLAWSNPGGLKVPRAAVAPQLAQKFGLRIRSQGQPGRPYSTSKNTAWNSTHIAEWLPSYQLPYGRAPDGTWAKGAGKTYQNVVHLVMFHGTHVPGEADIQCHAKLDPNWSYSKTYFHLAGYRTYASEFYLAQGKWIIQQGVLYIEDGGSYWGSSNCIGLALDSDHQAAPSKWIHYLDE